MDVKFTQLTTPTLEIAAALNKWENDPTLLPFIHPNPREADLVNRKPVTADTLRERLEDRSIYLIYVDEVLVGEVNYQIDPDHLYKKEMGTAWVGINIGEEAARGKGVGAQAMLFIEKQARAHGLKRMELGVFEFNTNAIKLYKKMGFQEIARIENFIFWQGKLWPDIRMEKYLK